MPGRSAGLSAGVPPWAVIVVLAVVVGTAGYFGLQSLIGRDGESGPPKRVRAGMYDLRAEAARMLQAQRAKGAGTNAP